MTALEAEQHGEAAQAEGAASQCVRVALYPLHRHEREVEAARDDYTHHGRYGRRSKKERDEEYALYGLVGCGVHQDWNERLAGAEYEDCEEDPRRDVRPALLMRVSVFLYVGVRVDMGASVSVEVNVEMRFILQRPVDPLDKVGEAESNQCPCRDITANRLYFLELEDGYSYRNTDRSQENGAKDMADSAKKCDEHGLGIRPLPCLAHHDEGQVMIRPEYGMNESDCYRRNGQKIELLFHEAPIGSTIITLVPLMV